MPLTQRASYRESAEVEGDAHTIHRRTRHAPAATARRSRRSAVTWPCIASVPIGQREIDVQVTAFATPGQPDWRWRIVNYAGEIIEESHDRFSSIAEAIAKGAKRLLQMNIVDGSKRPPVGRWISHRRRHP
jgi:hypothetical protein